jgi:hypothetical protein
MSLRWIRCPQSTTGKDNSESDKPPGQAHGNGDRHVLVNCHIVSGSEREKEERGSTTLPDHLELMRFRNCSLRNTSLTLVKGVPVPYIMRRSTVVLPELSHGCVVTHTRCSSDDPAMWQACDTMCTCGCLAPTPPPPAPSHPAKALENIRIARTHPLHNLSQDPS